MFFLVLRAYTHTTFSFFLTFYCTRNKLRPSHGRLQAAFIQSSSILPKLHFIYFIIYVHVQIGQNDGDVDTLATVSDVSCM
jgi:hypothetical protein